MAGREGKHCEGDDGRGYSGRTGEECAGTSSELSERLLTVVTLLSQQVKPLQQQQ